MKPPANKDAIERRMMALFGVMFIVTLVMVWAAVRNTRHAAESSDWVNHTHAVIMEIDSIQSSLNAAESSLLKYVLSGDARDQLAYREAYAEMLEHLEVARAMSRSEERRQRGLVELEGLVQQRVAFGRDVASARQSGLDAARQVLANDAGSDTPRQLRRVVYRLVLDEKNLLADRDRESYLSAQATRWTLYAGVGFNLVLLSLIFWLIRDDLAARRRAATALEEANLSLEAKVSERTAELAKSNESLESEVLERKWSQAALERQFRHNELIINSIGDAIFVISRRGNIIRLNPGATRLAGWNPQDLTAEPLGKVLQLAGAGNGSLGPILTALEQGHEAYDLRASLKTKPGNEIAVLVKCFPIRDSDKVVGGVVTCMPARG
ncbi:MAG: CHASE3 domain-containing protein [Verrucomicrobiota bacterium]